MLGLISCDKNDSEENYNAGVENYIKLLKSGSYESYELPPFSSDDIPALLQYRNDELIIHDFPRNGISSLYGPDCTLGMYALWTIESIRAVAIDSNYLIGRFPSLNPILAFREADELELIDDDLAHAVAAQAYYNWWENNKRKDFDTFKNIDPLANTKYRWH